MNPVGQIGTGMIGQVGRIHVQHQNITGVVGGRLVGGVSTGGTPNQQVRKPAPAAPGGKLMRLRCRFRPLHDAYIKNGSIVDDDADVIFLCGDGHQLRAHKVIMASSSKFFAKLFEDQANVTVVVSVPDIKVDIMKLILQLTYRDRVILTMKQIKEVGEFITIFGMAWTQFGYEEYEGDEAMTSLPKAAIPMQPVELPRTIIYVPRNPPRQPGGSPQRLSTIHQNQQNGVKTEEFIHVQQGSSNAPMSQLQLQNERHARKSKLTPRAVIEGEEIVEQDEEEDPENKMRDWMARLGKRDSTSASMSSNAPISKKMRADPQAVGNAPEQPAQVGYSCSICNGRFRSEMAWRWHEDRHVGVNVYKCQFCDELVHTPKLCYIHEKEVHGYSGMKIVSQQQQEQQEASSGGSDGTQQQQQQRRVFVRPKQHSKHGSVPKGYAAHSNKIKLAAFKKMQSQQLKKPNFINKHPRIAIGASSGSEFVDVKKVKQLHWLYVCQKCDNCADSVSRAMNHYNQCFPDKDEEFEATVVKERQGFYGKKRCPLCPRRYPQNSGFMIHCGHQHQKYRRLFGHTGAQDDQLNCLTCKKVFPEPTSFHEHVTTNADGDFHCGENAKPVVQKIYISPPVYSPPQAPQPKPPAKNPVGRPKSTNASRPRRVESPIESKASYKVQFHTPPKSARLANRAKAEASAEAAKAKQKQTTINFPSVDCPVCGEGDIPNISQHLQDKHTDLKIDVTRISSELLRCKNCTITFSICDMLDHKNCFENKEPPEGEAEAVDNEEAEASTSTTTTTTRRSSTGAGRPPAKPVVVDMDSLPPGVGRSPIERIEIDDLHSIQAIRSALKCKVCGLTAKRLGVIADCLRAHGIQRCSLCFNSYCSKADYTLHLRKCHGAAGTKLKCPLCPKAFSNAGQTSGHMYSTHWLQILKENERGGGTEKNKDEKDISSAGETDDGKEKSSEKRKGSANGSNTTSEQSFEESTSDDAKSTEIAEDGEGVDETVEQSDPLGEDAGEEDTMMQVEGSSEHEHEVDVESNEDDDIDEA